MNADVNLLFGVLSLQADLIDSEQFIEACTVWTTRKDTLVADLLVERGWLLPADKSHVEYLVERKVQKHDGDARASLAAVADDVRRSLENLGDADIQRSLCQSHGSSNSRVETIDSTFRTEDPHTLTRLHATGGMGQIWLARDSRLGRDVALKKLASEKPENPRLTQRFIQEAQITGQLEHPGILPIYELGWREDNHQPFYTMRFVEGHTLSEAVQSFHKKTCKRFDSTELLNLLNAFVTVCNTIAYAHSRGVLHRDLKGQNVALGNFGEVVVLDWGLAKRVDHPEIENDMSSPIGDEESPNPNFFTLEGEALGTPAYMAPEQACGHLDEIDERTDVYGLGAMLYEILTGQPPFTGSDTQELLRRVQQEEPWPPAQLWPDVPGPLETTCLRALAKNPEDRFATASELAQAVQQWQEIQRKQAERRLQTQQNSLVALTRSEIFAGHDLTTTLRHMTVVAAETLQVERVSVWRYTKDRRAIRCESLYELRADRHSAGMELDADTYPAYFQALATSEVIAAHDARQDARTREFTENYLLPLGIGAMMDAPIHLAGTLSGVVCHEHLGATRKWLPDEQLFGIAIANLVSQAISQWAHKQALEAARKR